MISLSSLGLFSTTVAPETSADSGLAYADSTKIIEDADEIRTDRCAIVFGNALLPDVLRSRVDNFAPLSFYA